jgi:hypothetical protein
MALSFNASEQNHQAHTKDKVDDASSLSYPQAATTLQRSSALALPSLAALARPPTV